jgi:hypothetical protein
MIRDDFAQDSTIRKKRSRRMKKSLLLLLAVLSLAPLRTPAQEAAKPKADERTPAVTPLRVQVLFTEFDGDKKISSLPYAFTVNADERRARPGSQIRTGARFPVTTGQAQMTYIDIGTNVDCSATEQEDGRYKLLMTVERSSVVPDTPSNATNPAVRQFRAEMNPVLKDGQTVEAIVSTDPLSGHTYHVTVTLNVVK